MLDFNTNVFFDGDEAPLINTTYMFKELSNR